MLCSLQAQKVIKGKVNPAIESLGFAESVQLKGTNIISVLDTDGSFRLEIPEGHTEEVVLLFKAPGYTVKETVLLISGATQVKLPTGLETLTLYRICEGKEIELKEEGYELLLGGFIWVLDNLKDQLEASSKELFEDNNQLIKENHLRIQQCFNSHEPEDCPPKCLKVYNSFFPLSWDYSEAVAKLLAGKVSTAKLNQELLNWKKKFVMVKEML